MKKIFSDFNFQVLDNPEFKEDSVREEIIAPIIKELGFKPDGQRKVVRGKQLKHPFVSIGSTRKKVTVIPDYILMYNDMPLLVIDAKSPNENIDSGNNVEQVFSYSIHPEIRTFYYALCNGKQINFFSRSELKPTKFLIGDIDENWMELERMIDSIENETLRGIKTTPDFGILLAKMGVRNFFFCKFQAVVASITKVSDSLFLIVVLDRYGPALADLMNLSFLLKKKHLKYFKECLGNNYTTTISRPLSETPYTFYFENLDVVLNIYSEQNLEYDFTWGSFKFLPFNILYLEISTEKNVPSNGIEIAKRITNLEKKFYR